MAIIYHGHRFVRYFLNQDVEVPGFYFPSKRQIKNGTEVELLAGDDSTATVQVLGDEREDAGFRVSPADIRTEKNPLKVWVVGLRGFLSENDAMKHAGENANLIFEIEVFG